MSRNKSVTVNMAYATQVGAVMNTAVGLLQAEEVGGMKKTMVGKSYSINVGDKFEISVGDSKLTMTTDSISITSKSILVAAEKSNTIIGKNVEINPLGEASAEGEEEESSAASTSKKTSLPEALAALEAGRADASPDAVDAPNVGTNLGSPQLGSDSGKYANAETQRFMEQQAKNINNNVMNHGGSIHSDTPPAYEQAQNKKTFNATVNVLSLAAGSGSATVLVKGSKYVVSKRALDLAKAGKQSVSTLLKGAKKAVPTTTSVPKAMATGAAGSAVIDMGSQKILKPNEPFSVKQTVAVATVGALSGGGGATVANAAKVPYATATNLPKVYKNTTSMKVFSQQKAAETVGKTAAKDALDD